MSKEKIRKLLFFNLGLCLANILLFSKAFLHIDLSGQNALLTALGVMAIVMSAALFGIVNYRLLQPARKIEKPLLADKDIVTLEDCAAALAQYIDSNVQTFSEELKTVIAQIGRLRKKTQTIQHILLERFSETEMSFGRFHDPVAGMERIMLLNVKGLLHRLNAFDEEEYEDILQKRSRNERFDETRRSIYNEYTAFVARSVDNNEEILLRLDKLILEISKLQDLSDGSIEEMDAVREIDALIHDAKWYK